MAEVHQVRRGAAEAAPRDLVAGVHHRRVAQAAPAVATVALLSAQDQLEKRVEERTRELEKAMKAAETANQAKSYFLASMSHELRTPLNAILGFGQLLEMNPDQPLSEKQLGLTRQILKGGEILLELIEQVLELSKIEAGKVSLTIENVNPATVIDDCLKMVKERASDNDVTLVDQTVEADAPMLRTDINRFRQVLLNLLSNAIKYNRPKGSVTITSALAEAGFQRFSVIDTGTGIAKDKQKKLFEPFNRLGLEAGEIEGSGIGLTITSQIIELLGGHIGFESEEGVGSTFWVEIPVSEDQLSSNIGEDQKFGSSQIAEFDNEQIRTLLYIEDNPPNLKLMEALIDRIPNLTMLSAPDAETGLDVARSQHPDLILMDINLPGMDGVEALENLRSHDRSKSIPVIAISAAAMPHEIARGKKAGFKEYITKPIKVPELLDAINEHLKQPN